MLNEEGRLANYITVKEKTKLFFQNRGWVGTPFWQQRAIFISSNFLIYTVPLILTWWSKEFCTSFMISSQHILLFSFPVIRYLNLEKTSSIINSYSSRTRRIWADIYNQRGSTRNSPSVFPYLVKLNNNGSYHGLREPIRKLENRYPELKIY